ANSDWYQPNLAFSLRILAAQFAELGRSSEALAVEQEAVSLYRELTGDSPGRYTPFLAGSLDSLGSRLSDVDRSAEALAAAREAARLYRELALARANERQDIPARLGSGSYDLGNA